MEQAQQQTGKGKAFAIARGVFVIGLAVSIILGALFWRLSKAPVDMDFMKPVIENALSYPEHNVAFKFSSLHLKWSPKEHAVFLNMKGGRLLGEQGQEILSIDDVAMNASFRHLLVGQFRPRVILIYGPSLSLRRLSDGGFDFGIGGDQAQAKTAGAEQDSILRRALAYIGHTDSGLSRRSPLSALRRFEIRQASLSVDDEKLGTQWSVPRTDIVFSAYRRQGLRVDADIYFGYEGLDRNSVHLHAVAPRGEETIQARLDLQHLSSRYLMDKFPYLDTLGQQDIMLDGRLRASLSYDFDLLSANMHVVSESGHLQLDVYDGQPLSYADLTLAASYDPDKGLVLRNSGATIEGMPVQFSGTVEIAAEEGGEERYQADVRVDVPQMKRDNFVRLWPEAYHYIGAYEWLGDKISQGTYDDVSARAQFSYVPERGEEAFVFDDADVDFTFNAMKIDYRAPLPPITGAKGGGHFNYRTEHLTLNLEGGQAGKMTITRADVELAHVVESGHGTADVYVVMNGALADVFAFLEAEPIAFDHGYDTARVKGQAQLNVNIGVPTHGKVQMEDVTLDIRGSVTGGQLPHILKRTDLSGVDARLTIDQNDIDISGKGVFGANPITFGYRGFLESEGKAFKEKITVKGGGGDDTLMRLGVDLSSFLTGAFGVDATYTNFGGGRQSVKVQADLTPAHVFAEPLGYDKPPGQAGQASFVLDLHNGDIRDLKALQVSAPDLSLQDGHLLFDKKTGALAGGESPYMRVGQSNGSVDFSVDAAGRYTITADMAVYDLRPLLTDNKTEDHDEDRDKIAVIASLQAQTLLTHKQQSVRNAQIYADIDAQGRFNQLEMDARAGQGSIYLRYKPNTEGVRVFRFEADDAGATLAAFGLYQQIRGGQILVHAEPISSVYDRNLVGVAELTNFRVVEAPTLAKLLSLTSFEGLSSGLAKEGIAFERLETQFDWVYRPGGSLLSLQEGRTSGAAIGLTFDGIVDQRAGTLDLSGTIVPVSALNSMIRSIPVLGEVLTGGSGVFAATYAVKGKTADPHISINPLSVLAPGIIRRILFE